MEMYNVAVAGATGAVGTEMIKGLERRNFPVNKIKLLASERSKGKILKFKGQDIEVEVLSKNSFENVDIALFSAGGDRSLEFAPAAAKAGCVVIDNSSAFRMDREVPLVVPEVNPEAAKSHKGIIANPNCSTIQMVAALKPIYDLSKITKIVVSTYQAVSGAGLKAIHDLKAQSEAIVNSKPMPEGLKFKYQIAFNCIPRIDSFLDNGYTKEEMKMVNETRKIMEDDSIEVSPTTVRVPVYRGHSESIHIVTENKLSLEQVRTALENAPGIIVEDDLSKDLYPMAVTATGKDDTYVGRIREGVCIENSIDIWVVSDNLLKGAATNAIQVAELLAEKDWVKF